MAPGARGPRSHRWGRPAGRALGLPAARSPPAASSRRLLSAMGSRAHRSPERPPLPSLHSGTPGRRHAQGVALRAEAAAGIPPSRRGQAEAPSTGPLPPRRLSRPSAGSPPRVRPWIKGFRKCRPPETGSAFPGTAVRKRDQGADRKGEWVKSNNRCLENYHHPVLGFFPNVPAAHRYSRASLPSQSILLQA